jgi:energy-coupling factor transporter ATP-binding protein EcfA2
MSNTIVLLSGKAGSGKDTLFGLLVNHFNKNYNDYNISQFSFGKSVKKIVKGLSKLYLNMDLDMTKMDSLSYKEEQHHDKTLYIVDKNTSSTLQLSLTVRLLLQHVATNILREELGDAIFARKVSDDIDMYFTNHISQNNIAVITDLRFPDELVHIKRRFSESNTKIIAVFIDREDVITNGHISESLYGSMEFDMRVNNNGTIADLEAVIQNFSKLLLERVAN